MPSVDKNVHVKLLLQNLDRALANPELRDFLVPDVLAQYRGFGGVRIEDDVVIWAAGNECMNKVPRTVADIEQFMAEAHRK